MSTTTEPYEALARAAAFAGRAPSLHNSQPWHWYVRPGWLDLRLEPARVLCATDPRARLAVLSCGIALHHAQLRLAAGGWPPRTVHLPDTDDPGLLARLMVAEAGPPDHDAVRLVVASSRRHTDRRATTGRPLDMHRIHTVRKVVRGVGADLTLLHAREVIALGQATEDAYGADAVDAGRQREATAWIGGDRSAGSGIPADSLPADPYGVGVTEPARLMHRAGTALIAESHHHVAVFALLSTAGDGRLDWLTAGQALSAGWLTATVLDVAMLPLSIVTEVTACRDHLRTLLPGSGSPQLALRLTTAGDNGAPATPRLPAAATVTRLS